MSLDTKKVGRHANKLVEKAATVNADLSAVGQQIFFGPTFRVDLSVRFCRRQIGQCERRIRATTKQPHLGGPKCLGAVHAHRNLRITVMPYHAKFDSDVPNRMSRGIQNYTSIGSTVGMLKI